MTALSHLKRVKYTSLEVFIQMAEEIHDIIKLPVCLYAWQNALDKVLCQI